MSDQAPPQTDGPYVFHAVGQALFWDYFRGGFAAFVVVGVLSVMNAGTIAWGAMVLLLLAIIGYLLNTVYRHGLRIEMTAEGVSSGWRNPLDPRGDVLLFQKHISWRALSDIQMRYFSRKRDGGQEGWIMLRLKGANDNGRPTTITFDGAHEGFTPVLTRAWDHARRGGLAVDDTTVANLEALGIHKSGAQPWTS